jgi:hypothetical protein
MRIGFVNRPIGRNARRRLRNALTRSESRRSGIAGLGVDAIEYDQRSKFRIAYSARILGR